MNETKNILITGGGGYIGLHTVKALKGAGFNPVIVDNNPAGKDIAAAWGDFHLGDLADTDFMNRLFDRYTPAAVIHMAASAEVGESAINPEKYYKNNVSGSLALFSMMKKHGVMKLVVSSTCAVYGKAERPQITEDTPRNPVNTYGRSKLMVEMILEDFARSYGLSFVALRYFNACGADPSGDIGENHDPETHLIPRALLACAGKISTLEIYGDDYETPDGTCIRDYIHVCDLARAHIRGVEYLLNGGDSVFLNLGTGKGVSVNQSLDSTEKVTGRKVPVIMKPRREGDSPVLVANSGRANAVLDFKTDYNDIDDIIATAWNYHAKQWGIQT